MLQKSNQIDFFFQFFKAIITQVLVNSQTYTFKSSKESTLSKLPSTASEVAAAVGIGEVVVFLKLVVGELILEVASSITMSM